MPYGVRKFPSSVDPRWVTFNTLGFDDQSTPPYLWRLITSGATGFWSFLNDGLLIPFLVGGSNGVTWSRAAADPDNLSVILSSDGTLVADSPIPPFTHFFSGVINTATNGGGTFHLHQTLPFAVQRQGPLVTAFVGGLDTQVPNPCYLDPAPWDAVE